MRVRLKHSSLARRLALSRLSQNRWALKMGLSSGHLSLLINGKRPYPGPEVRRRILEALGCPFDDLFEIEAHTVRKSSLRPTAGTRGTLAGRAPRADAASKRKGDTVVQQLAQDLRYGLRLLLKQRAVSLLAILTLALGIGANTAIFSLVNATLIQPLPYPDPSRLLAFWDEGSWSKSEIAYFRQFSRSYQGVAGFGVRSLTLTGRAQPVMLTGVLSTANLFDVLGAKALEGRTFLAEEGQAGRTDVALISHDLWRRVFRSQPDVVGSRIEVDGQYHQVVGILPPGFFFPNREAEIWVPFDMDAAGSGYRHAHQWSLAGRLATGVTLQQALAELDPVGEQMRREFNYPAEFDKFAAPQLVSFQSMLTRNFRSTLLALFAAVGFVLLIACSNVVNLSLVRLGGRLREIGIRQALGAGRRRILTQLLTESTFLALMGGAAGVALAYGGLSALLAYLPQEVRSGGEIAIDSTVLAFSLALSLLMGIVTGAAPLVQMGRASLKRGLGESGRSTESRSSRRFGGFLVVGEVALAVILISGAAMALRGFWQLTRIDPGFGSQRLLTLKTYPTASVFSGRPGRVDFIDQVQHGLEAIPGVESVGGIQVLPIEQSGWIQNLVVENGPERERVFWRIVTPGYLESMQIPLLEGRAFDLRDREAGLPVCIVNQTLAQRYFSDGQALGKRLQASPDGSSWLTIVGVAADVKHSGLDGQPEPLMYRPYAQNPMISMLSFVIRSRLRTEDLTRSVEQAIWRIDPDAPVFAIQSMEEILYGSVARPRLLMLLLALSGSVALALGVVGIYGVLSHRVHQRVREIGVRMALGACRKDVLQLVLSQGFSLTLAGLALGLAGALAANRLLEELVFEVPATDLLSLLAAPLILSTAAALACYLPARRASRLDPKSALRAG